MKSDSKKLLALNNFVSSFITLDTLIKNCCEDNPTFQKISTIKLDLFNTTKFYDISLRSYILDSEENFEVIIADVSKSVNAEKEILKNKYKGITLAKIAHELKNPITTINILTKSMKKSNNPTKVFKSSGILPKFDKDENSSDNSSDTENFNIHPKIVESLVKAAHTNSLTDHLMKMNLNNSNNNSNSPLNYPETNCDNSTLNFINCLCDFLLLLIEDLNCFVKMDDENLKHQPIELVSTNLEEILSFCHLIFETRQKWDSNKKNLKIVKRLDPNSPEKILTNSTKLKQVILNLMSNAYKFTASGEVRLISQMIKDDQTGQNYVRILIEDEGSGMSEEEQEQLFKPFSMILRNQNLNSNGSGLGLTIVKDTLEGLNSKIQFKSKLWEGSCFYFDLQVSQEVKVLNNYTKVDNRLLTFKENKDELKLELIDESLKGCRRNKGSSRIMASDNNLEKTLLDNRYYIKLH